MVGLPDGEKNVEDMYNCLGTIPACDGQTDRQTDILPRHIVRAMHTRRAVKKITDIRKYRSAARSMKYVVNIRFKIAGNRKLRSLHCACRNMTRFRSF